MSLGTAASYLASFRPAETPTGFSEVLVNRARDLMARVPLENAALDLAMAQTGLNQLGETQRVAMSLKQRNREVRAQRDQLRKSGALRFAGQMMNSLPDLGLDAMTYVDPMASYVAHNNFLDAETARRQGLMGRSSAATANALKQLFGAT